jgi:glycosyltransferase involved in cell wall biosynthesis
LVSKGNDVEVITASLPQARESAILNGVQIHRLKIPHKGSRYWFTFLSFPEVLRLSKKADLIHTTTYNAAFPAWFAAKLRRKKIVITVHEIFGSKWKKFNRMNWLSAKLHQLVERLIISLSYDQYLPVSHYTEQCLLENGVKKDKVRVIYNGIDYDLFNPGKYDGKIERSKLCLGDRFIYMYYGRPGVSKGVEYLVRSVPMVLNAIPGSKLIMILARDPLDRYNNIIDEIRKLNISNDVILLDPVSRNSLPGYIAAADCVVIPSVSEGFGFTAAEACAMQKPVVTSNIASLPEIVSGKFVLVQPMLPGDIATGIVSVYNKQWTITQNKIFTWQECVDGYIQSYKRVL